MTFENTTAKDLPGHNHIGLDWHTWVLGFSISTYNGFWHFEVGPLYIQWSKHG